MYRKKTFLILPVCRAAAEWVNVTFESSTLTSQLEGYFHNCQSMSTTSWKERRKKKRMRIIITPSSPKLVFLCLSPYVSQRDESDSLEWDGLERDNS
jgi:hypothetical protein